MRLDSIPLFQVLRGKLGYLNQREQLIAQNVANTDTPGYTPKDLNPFTIQGQQAAMRSGGGVTMATTSAGHIAPPAGSGGSATWSSQKAPDSETTLDGNQVVLEDQMIKMNETRMDYEAAISFYQKSLNMVRLAARRPGA